MQIFGLTITRQKDLTMPAGRGGWWPIIREAFGGAWQRNIEIKHDAVLSYHAVYACITLIASDISKLPLRFVRRDQATGVWTPSYDGDVSPLLAKPNDFQTRHQFWENWMLSKLTKGNTYVLKRRDEGERVVGLYILDPSSVQPLVSDTGEVFYQLQSDDLSGVEQNVVVPATEIIHDRFNCLFHPLVGVSPIFACGLSAIQGLSIQKTATQFFENAAMPGGILTAPGAISDDTAKRLKEHWQNNYGGDQRGRVAVLGDGLKFERMVMTSAESQLIEQLRWTSEVVCSVFHVPPYKIGVGTMPTYANIQSLNVEYFSQCLQVLIESAQTCLDEGLGIGDWTGTEFDMDALLWMDSVTQMQVLKEGVGGGFLAPDEARRKIDLLPVVGGATPYLQQQNYSLEALSKRDAQADPFDPSATTAPDEARALVTLRRELNLEAA